MLGITKLSTDHDTPGENQFGGWLAKKKVRTTSPTPAPTPVLIDVGAGQVILDFYAYESGSIE